MTASLAARPFGNSVSASGGHLNDWAKMAGLAAGSVGTRVLRREDPRLLTGRGRYVGDVSLPDMVEVMFVRSLQPHALIERIDTAPALRCNGVAAVLTAADLPRVTLEVSSHPQLKLTPQPVLAADRVRFVGEPIAMVLADSRYSAEDGVELVEVAYSSMGANAQPLFEHIPDGIVFHDRQQWGDVGDAFERAKHVVTSRFVHPRQIACPMEGRGCVASFDPRSGTLTLWASTQSPHLLQRVLAAKLGLPLDRIHVVMVDVGGGFGLKIPTHVEELAVALATMKLGRPVKWVEDRYENLIAAPHSRDQRIQLELALDDQLQFTGLRAMVEGDSGAYSFNSASSLTEAFRAARYMPGTYRFPAYAYDVTIRLTNKSPIAPYRGVGQVAAQCARELLIDKAAFQIGVDRFELRRRNTIREQDLPYTNCIGWQFNDTSFVEVLDIAQGRLGAILEDMPPPAPGWLRGFGISPVAEPSLAADCRQQVTGYGSPSSDEARVVIDETGTAIVTMGTPSLGQGIETTIAQVAADALGFALEDVAVVWSDTVDTPVSHAGSLGSRAAIMSGGAVGRAAEALRLEILKLAGVLLQADPEELLARDGHVWRRGEDAPAMPMIDVVRAASSGSGPSPGAETVLAATRSYDAAKASYSNACAVAIVAVDTGTGKVRVERLVGVEDAGTMINPTIVEGQFIGGSVQGIGMALYEQIHYDSANAPLTATLVDYLLPTAADIAPVELHHVVTPSSYTWQGVKGIGETGTMATTAAVAAAVNDAIRGFGASVEHIPLLPATVWSMLHDAAAPATS